MAIVVKPTTTGNAITNCAMTMASGVYSRCRSPSGPLRHRKIETQSPTTTGGSAMPVLTSPRITRRPRNSTSAKYTPSGMPSTSDSSVAESDTRSVRNVIESVSGSPLKMSWKAWRMPSRIRST